MMNRLRDLLDDLGITSDIERNCRLPVYQEAAELVDAGPDMFDRPQRMTPATLASWQQMVAAATAEGIELKLVSAFRSVDYQCQLIRQKLNDGRSLEDILNVNAIPGHSEHHTGCALDLHSGAGEVLTEEFENSPAFAWLVTNAARFNFYLSYPRDNPDGIDYEPWHWCYRA
ncbi:MAG: M15 family metallopeptidase [Pseudomonadales bacterium]